jgi:hypothetical protein
MAKRQVANFGEKTRGLQVFSSSAGNPRRGFRGDPSLEDSRVEQGSATCTRVSPRSATSLPIRRQRARGSGPSTSFTYKGGGRIAHGPLRLRAPVRRHSERLESFLEIGTYSRYNGTSWTTRHNGFSFRHPVIFRAFHPENKHFRVTSHNSWCYAI